MSISNASIHFNANGTPVCDNFDDIYFSTEDGLRETEYVFLDGNRLKQRWQETEARHFVIAETGFGTGLNFLITWWHHKRQRLQTNDLPRLHFISFEKYPLTGEDLARVHQTWPQLAELSGQLCRSYPQALSGCHRICFDDGQVVLDLWLGDIKDTLPEVSATAQGIVDAWYLDGFAPSKNVDMWQTPVFEHIARLSKQDGTLATFTCARIVRDGLSQAGFTLTKRKGFGRKREMLTATLSQKADIRRCPPFYYRHPNNADRQVAIIGGGIASAQMAYALAKRGYDIVILCKDAKLAQGASKNRQGALYPLLHAQHSPLSEFYAHAYTFALRQYQGLLEQGFDFAHQFCGVLLQSFDDKTQERHDALIRSGLWPDSLVEAMSAQQCSQTAGLSLPFNGIYYPQGGWINPAGLIDALLNAAKNLSNVDVRLDTHVQALVQTDDQRWQVENETFANVVICGGHLSGRFDQTKDLTLSPIRGQVSHLEAIAQTEVLSTVICYNGYITPALDGLHCIGASFIKGQDNTDLTSREHERNLERLQNGIGSPQWFEQLQLPQSGKAAVRCASRDHLPLAGAAPDYEQYRHAYRELYKGLKPQRYPLPPDYRNLYLLTGLGARGLCSAPLAAEIVAAQMNNEPYPASLRVLDALNPGREYIKQLKQQRPKQPELRIR